MKKRIKAPARPRPLKGRPALQGLPQMARKAVRLVSRRGAGGAEEGFCTEKRRRGILNKEGRMMREELAEDG